MRTTAMGSSSSLWKMHMMKQALLKDSKLLAENKHVSIPFLHKHSDAPSSVYIYICMYISVYICVCMCVCTRTHPSPEIRKQDINLYLTMLQFHFFQWSADLQLLPKTLTYFHISLQYWRIWLKKKKAKEMTS